MKYSRTRPSDEIRTTQINIRFTSVELDEFHAVCRELCLDMSNTLRFLVREKARALGVNASSVQQRSEEQAAPGS